MPVEYDSVSDAAKEVVGVSSEVAQHCVKQMGEMSCPKCGFDWDSCSWCGLTGLCIGLAVAVVLVVIVLWWKCHVLPARYGLTRARRFRTHDGRGRDEPSQADESMSEVD